MIRRSDIEAKLSAVVLDHAPLDEFEEWLAVASFNMHRDSSEDAIELASSIHSILSERDDRVLDDSQLKLEFVRLLPAVEVLDVPPQVSWSSNSSVISPLLVVPSAA